MQRARFPITVLLILFFVFRLRAQTAPAPELVLDVNAQSDAVAARGWPLLIRALVISADGQPLNIGLKSGVWTQALHLTIAGSNGAVAAWPAQLVQPASPTLSLSGIATAEAVWLVGPADTASIAAGVYNLSVSIDTTTTATSAAWSGSVTGSGAAVTLQAEPASLSAEDEASKYLAFAAYSRLKGDYQGVGAALDTVIAHQPAILEASKEKADLLAATGDYAGALTLYQQTLSKFLAANPKAAEPITMLARPIDTTFQRLAAQQQGGSGSPVASVAPGRTEAIIAPDSIVAAYGSGLATTTASSSGSLSPSLGGTTVSITDANGASASALIFAVSPGQVNYAAPASLALGPATVTINASDGSTHTGMVTIANVEPAVFTFNAAGLVAGAILRATATGQVNQNVYTLDAKGNVIASLVDVSTGGVYLVFYATGLRRAPQSQVTVTIGGVSIPVAYAGAQGSLTGLDQLNVLLPASLAGRGDVPIVVSVNGNQANTARITFQ